MNQINKYTAIVEY